MYSRFVVNLDICPGRDCEVPEHNHRDGKRGSVELSPRSREGSSECGVDCLKPRQIDCVNGELEGFGDPAFRAPTDPYTGFAFDLDATTRGHPRATSESFAAAGLDHPTTLETLRRLESSMEPSTGADTTTDLVPMDVEAILSNSIPKHLSPGEGETRSWGQLNRTALGLLPFQLVTLDSSTLATPPLSPTIDATDNLAFTNSNLGTSLGMPVQVRPPSPRLSMTVSSSGMAFESVESASASVNPESAETQEMIAGPRLFHPLDDDGME